MAATTVLASGTTQGAISALIPLADGQRHTLFIGCAGDVPRDAVYEVVVQSLLGGYTKVFQLRGDKAPESISGPIEYYTRRVSAGRDGIASSVERF